jgi:hypothetical protein
VHKTGTVADYSLIKYSIKQIAYFVTGCNGIKNPLVLPSVAEPEPA